MWLPDLVMLRTRGVDVLARLGKPDDLSAFCNSRRGVFEGSVNLAGDSPVEGVCLPQPRRLSPILWTP